MNVEELRALYRVLADDKLEEYAVDDDEFLIYLNEAVDEAVFRSDLIRDRSSAFCSVALTDGQRSVELHESIYSIARAELINSSGYRTLLLNVDYEELDRTKPMWRQLTESPSAFVHNGNSIEFVGVCPAQSVLNIEVFRLPLTRLKSDSDKPDIGSAYHRNLIDWVLFRVFSRPDSDFFDANRSAIHEQKFISVFGSRLMASSKRNQQANVNHHNKAWL